MPDTVSPPPSASHRHGMTNRDHRRLRVPQQFADVVVINKVSDVAPARLVEVRAVVRGLNSDARIVEMDFGRVPLATVLWTGLLDFDAAHRHPTWFKELNDFADHVLETEEYGIRSFTYRQRRPFAPYLFDAFLRRTWPGLIRAKGLFWLSTRTAWAGSVSLAGATSRTEGLGRWWAAAPRHHWPEDSASRDRVRAVWTAGWGDRRQEIVFIGKDLDGGAIRAALDACLVGSVDVATFDPVRHRGAPDPFPAWEAADAA